MNNSNRRMIRACDGDLADIVEEAIAALAAETDPMAAVYVRGGILVRPLRLHNRLKTGGIRRPTNALSLCWVDRHWLALRLAQIACFYLPLDDGEKKPIDPPDRVCQIILKSSPWDGLPPLTGIIEAPTIRPDGTLLTAPGYDPATGLLFDPGDTTFPPIPDAPTRADVEAAVRLLNEPYKAFPFVDQPSLSVALSSILTILVRRLLPAAPLFGYTAPDSSSGKTLLSNVPSYVATGRLPYLVSQARTPEEEEKRVLAALIECPTALTIDNIERDLQSDTLCSIITAPVFTGRVLGLTKTATVETNCMLSATGNNLAVAGDLSTRALFCRIDPGCERPQEREFAVNLDAWVPVHRGQIAAAALTIIRAYIAAGEPKPQAPNFGDRFGDWQRFCRFPLLWLGLADPVDTRERIEASDPVRQKLRPLLAAWYDYFGEDRTSVAAAIKAATSASPVAGDVLGVKATALNEAMRAVASEKDNINSRRLGNFISKYEGRIEGGLRFVRDGGRAGSVYWKAETPRSQPVHGGLGCFGGFDPSDYMRARNDQHVALFEEAKTFGSLIQVPQAVLDRLPLIEEPLARATPTDLFRRQAFEETKERLVPLVAQTKLLGRRYDCVVANPPYMGGKGMNPWLKKFAQDNFPDSKTDLMTCFMSRAILWTIANGFWSMINLPSWMFLQSFDDFRKRLLCCQTIRSLLHLGRGIFGSDFGSVSFVFSNRKPIHAETGAYRRLFEKHVQVRSSAEIIDLFLDRGYGRFDLAQVDLLKIPQAPIAYWVSERVLAIFSDAEPLNRYGSPRQGMATTNNDLFLRRWFEVSNKSTGFRLSKYEAIASNRKWFPINKGGEFRRWYGNNEFIVNYEREGEAICEYIDNSPGVKVKSNGRVINRDRYFQEGLTWSTISSGLFSVRFSEKGSLFETKGAMVFFDDSSHMLFVLAYMNTKIVEHLLKAISPTVDFHEGPIGRLPLMHSERTLKPHITSIASTAVATVRSDWNAYETSWDFSKSPLLHLDHRQPTLIEIYASLRAYWRQKTMEMQRLEEENNRLFIDAYKLQDELTPEVPLKEITLTCNPHYRYGGDLADAEREERLRADTMKELISYATGCMMGRYSLDEPGLIYAHSGNEGFDPARYKTFPADADGIIPLTDIDWFADDAANRFVEFLKVTWPAETLAENLAFVAESLGSKSGETAVDTLRRYLSQSFFKDHLQTYKRRPIYWLFSSGKQKAFEALVYLHRYNEGTLARMRMDYVTPLMSRLRARIEQLDDQAKSASSTAVARKLEKSRSRLLAKQTELVEFDEKLRHYADRRITLDLDDGVKLNYAKFADLLAEVKAVSGTEEK